MSWSEFNVCPVNEGIDTSYEISCELSEGQASPWYIVPAGIKALTATVSLTGGATAIVQTTTDSVNNIKDENYNVVYHNWGKGEVSASYSDTTYARVNAIRAIHTNNTGSVRFTVAI